jgi:protein-L-isoaspartate(D-aspartate) O-methyltransferase
MYLALVLLMGKSVCFLNIRELFYIWIMDFLRKYGVKIAILLVLTTFILNRCIPTYSKYDVKREQMVEEQIVARGIIDKKVIHAMSQVERHKFVPEELVNLSYDDHPLSIGFEQSISQPYIVAFMTELLELNGTSKVLEVGTGSGYQAAVLAQICKEVYTVEIVNALSEKAQNTIKEAGYNNVFFKVGDGYQGWAENAPFDAIIVTCAPENIPPALKNQLAEGGRMIIPVGRSYVQKLVLIKKVNGKMNEHTVLPVRFVPMVDEEGNHY